MRASSPLSAPLVDRDLEREQHAHQALTIDRPPESLAFVGPIRRRSMPSVAVASRTRPDFVLNPRRTTLELRDHMLRRGRNEVGVDFAAAPHTGGAVTLKDQFEAFSTILRR